MYFRNYILFFLALSCFCATCRIDQSVRPEYKTKHVIVIVVDGPRWTETWGDSARQYIPFRAGQLANEATMCTSFRNTGSTTTTTGHTAITTGFYQQINNAGGEIPAQPSFFQYWLKASGNPSEKAWVIASKDKLFVLSNCNNSEWKDKFMPRYDCGINGPQTGYRNDSITYQRTISLLNTHHPDLVLVNLAQPDYSGHANDWPGYLAGITNTDQYIAQVWNFIQHDPYYANTTTLIVTNDHGRHTDGHLDGFVSHGDECEGCRHIECILAGPDFKKGFVSDQNHSQVDIAATVAEIMGFEMPTGQGMIMRDAFK